MTNSDGLPPLRDPRNVTEALQRDALVRRVKKIRDDAVLDRNTIKRWNRMNPDKNPISTEFEDQMIAWCDGKGPMPTEVPDA